MHLTLTQRLVIQELVRQGYQVGHAVHPHEVFPARNNVASTHRRTLYRIGAMFNCPRIQEWSSDFILTQAVLDAAQQEAP